MKTNNFFSLFLIKGRGIFLFSVLIFLQSCKGEESVNVEKTFMVDFLNREVEILNKTKPMFNKIVEIDGKTESKNVENIEWRNELDMFYQCDVMKAALRDRYKIIKNEHEILYSLGKGYNLPVQNLKIYFQEDSTQITKIEATIKQENYLYKAEKSLEINFIKNNGGQPILKSYKIKGQRKLIFTPEMKFSIISSAKE